MKTLLVKTLFLILIVSAAGSCGVYNFTGGDTGDAETYQVNFFQNNAPIIEPGLDRDFTLSLQDLILNQTNLDLVTSSGDLLYEGEIVEYRISPMTATSDQRAAQNRLTMTVHVRFTNYTKEEDNFDQRFSFFYDYPADQLLSQVKDEAHQELFERITQDIFNASLANW